MGWEETGDPAPGAGMRGTKRRVRTHEDDVTLQVLGTLDRRSPVKSRATRSFHGERGMQ